MAERSSGLPDGRWTCHTGQNGHRWPGDNRVLLSRLIAGECRSPPVLFVRQIRGLFQAHARRVFNSRDSSADLNWPNGQQSVARGVLNVNPQGGTNSEAFLEPVWQ